ncbi:MAG TPA: hypothetical protein VLY87_01325 [Flavobacterium sp.]|nr:hypothetical protein [Flavobacterium sp.]
MSTKIDLIGKRILWLTLKMKPFEVMVTGEKPEEFRKPTQWIKSRHHTKTKSGYKFKVYDYVVFTNGYGKHRPYFIAEMVAFTNISHAGKKVYTYSNGLTVEVENGDYIIVIGKILEIGNYENTRHQSIPTNGCHTTKNSHYGKEQKGYN